LFVAHNRKRVITAKQREGKAEMRKGKSAGDTKSSSMGWGPLIVICMASFILVFDTTAMSVAINDLVVDLHTTVGTIQAVMAVYTLIMASMMLMGAKLCDMYGRKKVFLIGVAVYGVGTVTASLSPNVAVLLTGWSVIEGCAAAAMMPANMALLASTYTDRRNRATAFAIYGGIVAGGAALGPLLGGFIISAISWRAVFAIELILVVIILAGSRVLKEVEIDALKRPSMDIIGVIISAVSFFLIILAFLMLKHGGSLLSLVLFMLVLGIIMFMCFKLWTDRRKRENKTPLFDFDLFKSKTFMFGNITMLTTYISLMGIMFILPVYMQEVLKYSAVQTGIYLIPFSFTVLIIAFVAGPLSQKFNPKYLLMLGIIIAAIGVFVIHHLFSGQKIVVGSDLAIGLTICGIGTGFIIALLTNMLISAVKEEKQSEGSGMIRGITNLGSSMGTSVIGSVLLIFVFSGIVTGVLSSPVLDVDMPEDKLITDLQDYANKMQGEHANINLSQYPEEKVNEFKSIVNTATQSAMKQSFLVIFSVLVVTLVFALFIPAKKQR